jgi:hypothetical protein
MFSVAVGDEYILLPFRERTFYQRLTQGYGLMALPWALIFVAFSDRKLLIKLPCNKPITAFFLQAVDACVFDLDVPLVDAP